MANRLRQYKSRLVDSARAIEGQSRTESPLDSEKKEALKSLGYIR
jgi:hypothetical protein